MSSDPLPDTWSWDTARRISRFAKLLLAATVVVMFPMATIGPRSSVTPFGGMSFSVWAGMFAGVYLVAALLIRQHARRFQDDSPHRWLNYTLLRLSRGYLLAFLGVYWAVWGNLVLALPFMLCSLLMIWFTSTRRPE